MPKYRVSVYFENIVEAEDEFEAKELIREDTESIMKDFIEVELIKTLEVKNE